MKRAGMKCSEVAGSATGDLRAEYAINADVGWSKDDRPYFASITAAEKQS
jgi:hypothetical protein